MITIKSNTPYLSIPFRDVLNVESIQNLKEGIRMMGMCFKGKPTKAQIVKMYDQYVKDNPVDVLRCLRPEEQTQINNILKQGKGGHVTVKGLELYNQLQKMNLVVSREDEKSNTTDLYLLDELHTLFAPHIDDVINNPIDYSTEKSRKTPLDSTLSEVSQKCSDIIAQLNKWTKGQKLKEMSHQELDRFTDALVEYDDVLDEYEGKLTSLIAAAPQSFASRQEDIDTVMKIFYLTAQRIVRIIVKDEGKKLVKKLCDNLHKEINANILLFLAYLDTSGVLLEEIKFSSMLPFEDLTPITLKADDELYNRLADLVNSLKADVLNSGVNSQEHRRILLAQHDKEDRAIQHASSSEMILSQEEIEIDKDLVDFRNTMFVTQIMGQIVKNQQEILKKDELIELIEEAYCSTFRALAFITQAIEKDRISFIEEITKNPRYSKEINEDKLKERLNRLLQVVLMKFCMFSFARLSLAVGSSGRGMSAIYDKVAQNIDSPAAALISFIIKTYYGSMKATELKSMVNKYKNNPVVLRLINARVRNYVYNHELSHDKLSEFGSITGMRLIDSSSVAIAKKNRGK